MSQFGSGPKPPGWGRPPVSGQLGQPQIPGAFSAQFAGMPGGQFGVPNTMGMMGMPLVNQAAFQQPGMNMGMMAQQAQLNAANAAKMAMQQQQNASQPQQKNQRTFVGVVTKMHDSYGFVDDDVFFQHSVIRGALPRVSDRVMVEATFNPNMPFKWNAHRVQTIEGGGGGMPSGPSPAMAVRPPIPPVQQAPPPSSGSRWGPQSAAPNRVPSPRRRSPPRRSPPRRATPPRRTPPRRRSPSPRRASPRRSPARRPSPHRESRKRERSPASGTPHERTPMAEKKNEKKEQSASPPRRRARIIPRYVFNGPKHVFTGSSISTVALRKRFTHLYVPSDFVDVSLDWINQIPVDSPLDLSTSVQYHIFHKDVELPEGEVENIEVSDADPRFQVKVALLAHGDKLDLEKKTWGLLPDGSTDDSFEPVAFTKNMHLLVGARGKELCGIGGAWSPSADGPNPLSLPTMIKTAIRTTRSLTGIDLSSVSAWYQLVQVRYYRSDRTRRDRVTLLLADTSGLVPDEESLGVMETVLREELIARMEKIDGEAEEERRAAEEALKKEEEEKEAQEEEKKEEEAKEETKEEEGEGEKKEEEGEEEEKKEEGPTHWSKIDVKALKVAELKTELEARGLEVKGIKTLLAQRLQEALDKEKDAEEKKKSESQSPKKEKNEEKKEEKGGEGEKKDEKSEEQRKKEEEEKRKEKEKAEKDRKERKASLEKHFAFPKEPKVLVFPSKTAKGGKFDCKVVSLASLLDYREADNKESQFELFLFAEALRDVFERTFCFRVYTAVTMAGDKDVEKKRREEAREPKKKEEEGEGEKEGGEEGEGEKKDEKEKDKKKEEKVELRSVVIHRETFDAFAHFDQNLCGYIHERDLEDVISAGDLGIPRGQIQKLAKKLASASGKVNYRYLTDSLVDPDGETRFVPGQAENAPSVEELARGYGVNYKEGEEEMETDSSTVAGGDAGSGLVTVDGVMINVKQKLNALRRLEGEKDAAAAKIKELETSLKNIKDTKDSVEKKKKRLEDDVEKYQKRLRDTEKSLKLAQDEVSLMKSGVSDMKDLARKIIGVADKTLPKKEKKKEEPKEEKKENGTVEKHPSKEGKEEEEEPMAIDAGDLLLADQVGGDDEGEGSSTVVKGEESNGGETAAVEDTPMAEA